MENGGATQKYEEEESVPAAVEARLLWLRTTFQKKERKKRKKSVTNEILPHMILTSRERWLRMKILNVCKKKKRKEKSNLPLRIELVVLKRFNRRLLKTFFFLSWLVD